MRLYLKQKVFSLTDKYNIFNENEELIYFVKSEFFTFGAKFYVCDHLENELFFIKQRLFNWLPTYEIYYNNELCATIKKSFTFFKPNLTVTSKYGDFMIQGDAWNMNYQLFHDGVMCGNVAKKWLAWSDTYELNINDDANAAFICTLMIAIDHCLHNENNKQS